MSLVDENRPHLVLLDLLMPGADGLELMRDILATVDVPVIFLSANGRDGIIAQALELGAADYIVKPFSPAELVARIRAALRRSTDRHRSDPTGTYVVGDLTIDYSERLVTMGGRAVQLTATEYRILFELSLSEGRLLTHDQLMRRVWGPKVSTDRRTLRTHLSRLRHKLGEAPANSRYILGVPRFGYRMAKGTYTSWGMCELDRGVDLMCLTANHFKGVLNAVFRGAALPTMDGKHETSIRNEFNGVPVTCQKADTERKGPGRVS